MFSRVVNLLTFKIPLFQGRRGKGTRRFHPTKIQPQTPAIHIRLPSLSGPIRSSPELSGVSRGSGPQKSEPIRGSENRNPDLSEAIWTYPNLSEPSRFFFRPTRSIGRVPLPGSFPLAQVTAYTYRLPHRLQL